MKKLSCIISILFSVFLLTACMNKTASGVQTTNNSLIFSGQSENWTASLEYTKTQSGETKELFTLTYKKKEKYDGHISYSLKRNGGSMSGDDLKLNDNNTATKTDQSPGSISLPTENEIIEVSVGWGNEKEDIQLKKQ